MPNRITRLIAPITKISGFMLAKLFGEEPSQQISSDLRRLKQVLETGEVVRSDASMVPGRPHAARPSVEVESERKESAS